MESIKDGLEKINNDLLESFIDGVSAGIISKETFKNTMFPDKIQIAAMYVLIGIYGVSE